MKRGPNKVRALILASCVAMVPQAGMSVFAQSSTGTTTTVHKKSVSKRPTSIEKQMQEMRDQFQQQQEEINQLRQQLQSRDQQLQQAQDTAQQAQQAAQQAQAQVQAAQQSATQSNEAYTNLHQAVQGVQAQAEQAQQTATLAEQDQKELKKKVTHPDDIYYKGITISPKGSFLAAETVWRSGATGGDINTAFTGVPLQYSPAAQLSEFQATGRQSRIAIKATGKLADWTMTGYYEMDWLGTGITSNNNQSNSYVVRQRQLWADAKLNNGWDFSGGQGWSLVTETTQGLTRGTEVLPSTIDPQYEAGFVWARQYSFRVAKQFGDKMWLGASAESAEILNPAGSNLPTNLLIGSGGTSGGLYNSTANYSFNVAPDMIAKAAFEPAPGQHYEVFGIARFFRDRIYPTTGSPYNDTVTGGGFGASGRAAVLNKKLTIGLKGLYGEGVGRYGSSTIADITLRPDATISPLHGFSALSTVEFNPNKRLNIYANYSGDYIGRDYTISGGKQVGYGVYTADMSGCQIEPASTAAFPTADPSTPGNATNKCSNNNKDVQELTIGYWFYIHNGAKGGLRQGIQYSNIRRDLWSGQGGTLNPDGGAHGNDNMVFTSFRYYLP
jgi:TolA-binding protein